MDGSPIAMSQNPDSELPVAALTVESWLPGGSDAFIDGWRHAKTAPCTIVAVVVRGAYEVVRRDGARSLARRGEAFVAQDGEWLDITHRAERPGRTMAACWAHLRVTVFGTQDACALLDLPPILGEGPAGEVRRLIEGSSGTGGGLERAARQAEAGLAVLRILARTAPLSEQGRRLLARAADLAALASWARSRLGERIALDDLAAVAGLSKSRLHARMQRELGLAPMAWIRELRLQAARTRLLSGDEPVGEIGAACGFSDPFHFSRAVRHRFGMSPSQVRASRRFDAKL